MSVEFSVRAQERVIGRGMQSQERPVSLDGALANLEAIDWRQAFSSAGMSPGSVATLVEKSKAALLEARTTSSENPNIDLLTIQTRSPRIADVLKKLGDVATHLQAEGFDCHLETRRIGNRGSGVKDTRETEVKLVASLG